MFLALSLIHQILYLAVTKSYFMKNKNSLLRGIAVSAFLAFSTLSAQNYESTLRNHINSQSTSFRTIKSELRDFKVLNADPSSTLKGAVLNIQQQVNGIPVYGSHATALIKDDQVSYMTDNFRKDYQGSLALKPSRTVENIFGDVLRQMSFKQTERYSFNKINEDKDFVDSKLVYFPQGEHLVLAYEVNFEEEGSSNYWHIVADASNGKILMKENLLLSCSFEHDAFGRPVDHEHIGKEIITKNTEAEMSAKAPDNAAYRVFALPIEAPNFGNRTLVTNPWDAQASPEGWHSDGTNRWTITRGNNVHAYLDLNGSNVVGASADGGANRVFDFPLDVTKPVGEYTDGSITNLFYVNNKMHDIFYKFGFTETARNFQQNNFGKGGAGNDYVMAEARDGGGMNNANFATPSDGNRPRMQMFLWDPSEINRLKYNSPTELLGRMPDTRGANFGPNLTPSGITGDIKIAEPIGGCETITNDLTGKIALVERGVCNFVTKVKNAQLAGAKAVVIYNLPDSPKFTDMGGTDSSITIPSVLVPYADGDLINQTVAAGKNVNVTLYDDPSKYIYKDGSLDNGIVIHEYGHGISNRMTGNGYSCLNSSMTNEQMGEGWSDFFALMLTNRPGDNAGVPRGIGTFAIGEPTSGAGIRPRRYSPDFNVNNYTYGKTNGMYYSNNGVTVPDVHSIGFVWATMLWDLHWKYAEKYGYSSDVTADPNSGSARVLQAVVDGLKLQGCYPNFVKGRDAIIAADEAATGGENKCMIWDVFAKRGLGVNASPGATSGPVATALKDQVEDFTVPGECMMSTADVKATKTVSVYPNPAKNEIFLKGGSAIGRVNVKLYDMGGKLVYEGKTEVNSAKAISTAGLPDGVYILKADGIGVDINEKVIIRR